MKETVCKTPHRHGRSWALEENMTEYTICLVPQFSGMDYTETILAAYILPRQVSLNLPLSVTDIASLILSNCHTPPDPFTLLTPYYGTECRVKLRVRHDIPGTIGRDDF